jgi:hypothetical protein
MGETLMIVWSLPDTKYYIESSTESHSIRWLDKRYVQTQCDFSIMSFVKTLVKMHK